MLLYYITDRTQFVGNERERRSALLRKIVEASRCGVDFIQIREKDLRTRELEEVTRAAVSAVRENSQHTRLLVNSCCDVAIASGADGVHLRSDDISPHDVRAVWANPVIAVSCHTPTEVARSSASGADFVVLAPVFEKAGTPAQPAGMDGLKAATRHCVQVFALGGITTTNARACVEAGAAGVAGIRLFQQNDVGEIVQALRAS